MRDLDVLAIVARAENPRYVGQHRPHSWRGNYHRDMHIARERARMKLLRQVGKRRDAARRA